MDGPGEEGCGHFRQEKQCKAEPADMRNKGPARVKGLCLVIEKAQLRRGDKVMGEPEGLGGAV